MNKYYINTYHHKNKSRVGLFTAANHEGRGTCCGWYTTEFFTDTTLIASYVSEESTYNGFDPHHTDEKRHNKYFKEVAIQTHMWTCTLTAETDDEAIMKFFNGDWTSQWEDKHVKQSVCIRRPSWFIQTCKRFLQLLQR